MTGRPPRLYPSPQGEAGASTSRVAQKDEPGRSERPRGAMTALIDGNVHAAQAARRRRGSRAEALRRAPRAAMPRLDVVIVGDHPASRAYVTTKTTHGAARPAIDGRLIELPETIGQRRAARRDRAPQRRSAPSTASWCNCRLPGSPRRADDDRRHPAGEGRRRLSPDECRQALHRGEDRPRAHAHPRDASRLADDAPSRPSARAASPARRPSSSAAPTSSASRWRSFCWANDCTVTIAHSRKSTDLPAICREADILIAAVGRPEMVKGDWIKDGAVVIDVGINRVPTRGRQGPPRRRRRHR